jgi:hypothetical protein
MKKIYYEKRGRRYVPVAEYNEQWMDSFTKGHHLVQVYPGGSSRRYNIDPAYAPLIAASRAAKEAMCDALRTASEIQPKTRALTPEQLEAWEHLIKVFGEDARCLTRASSHDIAEAGIQALQQEADRLMKNPSVQNAYEQFLFVCKLTESHNTTE